jgi:hypothetical protein
MRQLKSLFYFCIGLLIAMLVVPAMAHAAMCEAVTTTGEKVYKFIGTPTLNLSGTVATLKKCPVVADISFAKVELKDVVLDAASIKTIIIPRITYVDKIEERITYTDVVKERIVYVDKIEERIIYKDVEVPSSASACMKSLASVCDPKYGGIQLFTNPTLDPSTGLTKQACVGVTIKAGSTVNDPTIWYAAPEFYSAQRQRADGTQYCGFTEKE